MEDTQALIDHDPLDPGPKRRPSLEAVNIVKGVKKCLLEGILGRSLISQHTNAEVVHGAAIQLIQAKLRRSVAFLAGFYEVQVYVIIVLAQGSNQV